MNKPPFYHADSKLDVQTSYINGRYVEHDGAELFDSIYPATGEVICQIASATAAQINAAVESAEYAFEQWSNTPAIERARVLRNAVEILRSRNQELAELETLDTGKPLSETTAVDIATGADVIEYYAGLAPSIQGQHIDLPPNAFATVRREPIGVCAGIGAWNYPIQIAMWKSGPALACGNTMVFKPAEQTPLSTLKLAEIYTEAGLPDGVFNVVHGARETGAALISHPKVSKVTLTGSVETGKKVMAQSASALKKVTLELGGKSPVIVFNDANIDNAVNGILAANFYSTGQVCSNGTRVFIQRGIYQDLISKVVERCKAITVGDPFDPNTQMGPVVSAEQHRKVLEYMRQAKSSSAQHLCGGDAGGERGYFVSPAVFADCTDDMPFVQEEVFGPLMAILPFDDEAEVLQRANNTDFGLSGAVFTQDFARAHRVANKLQAGVVWINDYNITPPEVPFGGYKQSGIGRENGLQALEHYTQVKTVYANLGDIEPGL